LTDLDFDFPRLVYTQPLRENLERQLIDVNRHFAPNRRSHLQNASCDAYQTALVLALCSTVFGATLTVAQKYGDDQGSGSRNASKVSVLLQGHTSDVVFFGPQTQFVGLGQVNVQIPPALAGQGDVHIALTADGQDANDLLIQVK
jgi:uncharacterized protein (TIGR03437 family)